MDFPQYRKRFDSKSFYKIMNERTFEEVQLIGDKIFVHEIKADKYFEIVQIQEMLKAEEGMYFMSNGVEYDNVRKNDN